MDGGIRPYFQYNLSLCNIERAYNTIKKLSRNTKTKSTVVKNKGGDILMDEEEISMRWKEYLVPRENGMGHFATR